MLPAQGSLLYCKMEIVMIRPEEVKSLSIQMERLESDLDFVSPFFSTMLCPSMPQHPLRQRSGGNTKGLLFSSFGSNKMKIRRQTAPRNNGSAFSTGPFPQCFPPTQGDLCRTSLLCNDHFVSGGCVFSSRKYKLLWSV